MKTYLLLIFLVYQWISAVIPAETSKKTITCYVCDPVGDETSCTKNQTQCEGDETTSCLKVIKFIEGKEQVTKGCVPNENGGRLAGCLSNVETNYEEYRCFCHEKDLCNFSEGISVALKVTIGCFLFNFVTTFVHLLS